MQINNKSNNKKLFSNFLSILFSFLIYLFPSQNFKMYNFKLKAWNIFVTTFVYRTIQRICNKSKLIFSSPEWFFSVRVDDFCLLWTNKIIQMLFNPSYPNPLPMRKNLREAAKKKKKKRKKKKIKKIFFSLVDNPLPPPPPLSGLSTK